MRRIQYPSSAFPVLVQPPVIDAAPDAWEYATQIPLHRAVRARRGLRNGVFVSVVQSIPDTPPAVPSVAMWMPLLAIPAKMPDIRYTYDFRFAGMVVEPLAVLADFNAEVRGRHRVANAAQDAWLLYVGVGSPPNLSGAPTATSASLPFSQALSNGTTNYVVVRRRNAYGLVSGNIKYAVFAIGTGTRTDNNPSAPLFAEAYNSPGRGGYVIVRAEYAYADDGDFLADTWRLYIRTNGTDPVPSSDIPITVSMAYRRALEHLFRESGAYANATDFRVIVRTYSSLTGKESTNTDVLQVAVDAAGPSFAVNPGIYGGDKFRQD